MPSENNKTNIPIFYFDRDCGLCRYWTNYWKQLTGDHVEYREFEGKVPGSSEFVETDGRVFSGAQGVARLLSYAPGKGWFLWLYKHIPPFAWISEFVYKQVSKCRTCAAKFTRLLWGENLQPSTFFFTRRLFLRLIGLVYFIAFLAFGLQIPGLIGEQGILPAGSFLNNVHQMFGSWSFLNVPTLAWINSSGSFLQMLAFIGAAFGLLAFIGIQLAPMFFVLWILYLSLFYAGQTFMGFQWDTMLLEVGFLAIFFAPMRFASRINPSAIVVWLYRFLIFRLMLGSGFVKLASGDLSWRSLSALDYHYFTQPIPNPISWFAHQLPLFINHASVLMMFVIQLILPFFIFAPRRFRFAAATGFVLLEGLIAFTGNFSFFNLLTLILVIPLFDDAFFRYKKSHAPHKQPSKFSVWTYRSLATLVIALFLFQIPTPFRLVNPYGVFATITTSRQEIVMEGSMDGKSWQAYEFKYKPGDVMRHPPVIAPYQPRLDWQMWFAALSSYEQNPWFLKFATQLLNASPDVLSLLANDPFHGSRPRYIRAALYEYTFTTMDERRETGAWWKREGKGLYMPQIQRRTL
ncbi:MAG: lipase maturation factor family protein [Patescibacteria group bacterium]